MNEEQLQDVQPDEQERGSAPETAESHPIDLDAVFESEEFKKRFQSAVDSEVRVRIDKWKAKKAKEEEAAKSKPEETNPADLDARIQEMLDRRLKEEREAARLLARAVKKAERFGIDLDSENFAELTAKQKLALMEALEAKAPDIARNANAGADYNAEKKPKDPESLTPAEIAMAEKVGVSPEDYKKQKQAIDHLRSEPVA